MLKEGLGWKNSLPKSQRELVNHLLRCDCWPHAKNASRPPFFSVLVELLKRLAEGENKLNKGFNARSVALYPGN